jgi:hypothetical protein
MTIELILFVALVALTLFSSGVQVYIHFEAYPLLAFVGKKEFAAYLKEYEKRLTVPLLVPDGLALLVNIILIFARPPEVNLIGIIILLILNILLAVVTIVVATPVYNRIKAAGVAAPDDMRQLMRINLLRLLIATASTLIVLILLLAVLAA